jgi:hypothetical protein
VGGLIQAGVLIQTRKRRILDDDALTTLEARWRGDGGDGDTGMQACRTCWGLWGLMQTR